LKNFPPEFHRVKKYASGVQKYSLFKSWIEGLAGGLCDLLPKISKKKTDSEPFMHTLSLFCKTMDFIPEENC